ncbi:hypothetical protein JOQ06_010713, partial [Pogonophryne albipinna]
WTRVVLRGFDGLREHRLSLGGTTSNNSKVNKGQGKDLDNDEAQRKRLRVVKERWYKEGRVADGNRRKVWAGGERE